MAQKDNFPNALFPRQFRSRDEGRIIQKQIVLNLTWYVRQQKNEY